MDHPQKSHPIDSITAFAKQADYSLLEHLSPDPQANNEGIDHDPREVLSGHYVPVKPTPLPDPAYVVHSERFFETLGLDEALAKDEAFMGVFSGDLSKVPPPMRRMGWATGYALSIYGREYYHQCPFGTGNGYGDGRAISVFEGVFGGKRWEFQLKGGGRTPYCRGADGRAVLRSSIREFIAQEHMHALGVPTTRSLTLYVSQSERVRRPWYSQGARTQDPDRIVEEPVAITTRVASSFLRVGQIELFGRRARKEEHPRAKEELLKIVRYAIWREYAQEIDTKAPMSKQILAFAKAYGERLALLVGEWIRVGYCQGNFNSDNCAIGGFTLDYGPFGFCERFDPNYQPWTGGGEHFAFFNQPTAAHRNFLMFCLALKPLLIEDEQALKRLQEIFESFSDVMQAHMERMWCAKLGLKRFDAGVVYGVLRLLQKTKADYTIFFRKLSTIPDSASALEGSFYEPLTKEAQEEWHKWLRGWQALIDREYASKKMKRANPKYILREWLLKEAYESAYEGDLKPLYKLLEVMSDPYGEQSKKIEQTYDRLRPPELFGVGAVAHLSCSS